MKAMDDVRRWRKLLNTCLAVAKEFNLEVLASDYYQPDAFLWVPGNNACHAFSGDSRELLLQPQSVRSHYTSLAHVAGS
jgi:hypothetical protein